MQALAEGIPARTRRAIRHPHDAAARTLMVDMEGAGVPGSAGQSSRRRAAAGDRLVCGGEL